MLNFFFYFYNFFSLFKTTYGQPIGSQIYSNPNTINKTMPPPSSGPQQPRRHPDFIKEQQYSSYNQQRPGYTGISNLQYNYFPNVWYERKKYTNSWWCKYFKVLQMYLDTVGKLKQKISWENIDFHPSYLLRRQVIKK